MNNRITILVVASLVLSLVSVFGQQTKGLSPIGKKNDNVQGTTRAVIVGISDYQSEKITDLQYAHKDAEAFAKYLTSPLGANVDSNHITILLNEKATSGNFVSALYGLMEESKEGDLAIIYFSGHGDVESLTLNQPGFLLCWDAPSRVYMGGGTFGLAYLQEIISTLSLKSKAKVLVITDACRSGTLAGSDIGGANATAANLSKQYANEIKIMSCQPNEYALEGKEWGGGRGVFSYYLMNGIQGLADRNEDGEVSLSEIDRYLEDHVSQAVSPHSQFPLTVGSKNTIIATVSADVLAELKNNNKDLDLDIANDRGIMLDEKIFSDTSKYNLYLAFNDAINKGHLLFPNSGSAYEIFNEIKDYSELQPYVGLMRRNLSAALQDEAQQAINDYLAADPSELKNRWNFNTKYNRYPEHLKKSAELLGKSHFFYSTLMARSFYFEGLITRLRGEQSEDQELLKHALALQDSCLTFLINAPYALNEKGYIYYLLKQYDDALPYFNDIVAQTPKWPLPWLNMSNVYKNQGDYKMAINAALKAIEIDSTLELAHYVTGTAYEKLDSNELAHQYLMRALTIDSTQSSTYFALATIASKTKNNRLAEKYLLKSLTYDSQNIDIMNNLGHLYLKMENHEKAKEYFLQAKHTEPYSESAQQGIIEFYFITNNLRQAKDELHDYVKKYPHEAYAFYLLSSVCAGMNKADESILYLEIALQKKFNDFSIIENDKNFSNIKNTRAYLSLKSKYALE